MALYKTYRPHPTKESFEIKFTIAFNRDRYNWATGEEKKIGYEVSAIPVQRGEMFEQSGTFTGFYSCILEIDRQSTKRLKTAVDLLESKIDHYLEQFKTPSGYYGR